MRAFIDIVLSEGYEAVTVERVAERADVGRSTFYMHYRGKEDILKRSLTYPSSHLVAILGADAAPQALLPVLAHFQEQRRVDRVFLDWPIRPIWAKCLGEMMEPRLAALVRQTRARPLLPVKLIALQIAEAQIALVVHWLLAHAQLKPEPVAEALIAQTRALQASLLRAAP